jgi:CheY-like chemotaxis protein
VLAKCEVTAVGTAGEAEAFLGQHWDAFIFDVALPDGCGLRMMRKAREAQPTAGALVISGLGREEDADAATAMGAYYLGKPFTPGDILRFLEECLPRARGREEADRPRVSSRPVPDFSNLIEAEGDQDSGLIPSPFPPDVAKFVAAAKASGLHASTADAHHAFTLAELALSVTTDGLSAANFDACAKAAGVSRQTLQDFATLTARWSPDWIADMLSMTDRNGKPITKAVLLKVARATSGLRLAFDQRLAKGELDLGALALELEQRRSSPPRR